jgi:hypothetical protein
MQGGVGGGRREASPYPDPAIYRWDNKEYETKSVKQLCLMSS